MKKSIGMYLTILSAIAAVVGVVAYYINCGTNYFANLGINYTVMGCAIAAIVIQIVYIIVTGKGYKLWHDILAVLPPVLMFIAAITLVGARVNGIAAVMTFENNAENMADLSSALISIVACVVAALIGIVASFFDTVKEKKA